MSKSIIMFTADWCTVCPQAKIELHRAIENVGVDPSIVETLDVREKPDLTKLCNVQSLPVLALMLDGHPVEAIVGARDYIYYESKIRHFMEAK